MIRISLFLIPLNFPLTTFGGLCNVVLAVTILDSTIAVVVVAAKTRAVIDSVFVVHLLLVGISIVGN